MRTFNKKYFLQCLPLTLSVSISAVCIYRMNISWPRTRFRSLPCCREISFKFQLFIKISFNSGRAAYRLCLQVGKPLSRGTIKEALSAQKTVLRFLRDIKLNLITVSRRGFGLKFYPSRALFLDSFRIDRRFHVKRNFSIFCLLHC